MTRWYSPAEISLARLTAQIEAGQQVHNLQVVEHFRREGKPVGDVSPRKVA
jgi:hypothetical protein